MEKFYAGTTAIIYNFDILYNFPSGVTEIGIAYYKTGGDVNYIRLTNESGLFINYKEEPDYLFYIPMNLPDVTRNIPGKIVIRNLDSNSNYMIYYYYKQGSNEITIDTIFPVTMEKYQDTEELDVKFNCTSVSKDEGISIDEQSVKNEINKCCDIFNSMGAYSVGENPTTTWNTWNRYSLEDIRTGKGSFTAKVVSSIYGAAATADMHFTPAYATNHSTIVHELAHDIMNPIADGATNSQYSEIKDFMEFATGAKSVWNTLGSHVYPIISSASYNEVENYLVAAACYVCRNAYGYNDYPQQWNKTW